MKLASIFLWPCTTLLFLLGIMVSPAAAVDSFPEYSCLQANVAFWKKVYAQYPSNKGLIHDRQNLGIIYETINLAGDGSRQSVRANECLVEAVKEKYRRILLALAQKGAPSSPEEKRVAGLFGASVKADTLRQAAEDIRFQRCLSDRFRAGVARSGRYLGQIKDIFIQYGLPSDLAYLPHVESSFDYQAYSKAGAAGIWQLMPATGRRFLTISSTLDERRDPILATHAAAKYLQGNYRKLQNWPLALTAYNHGLTAMLRARNSLGTYEKIFRGYDGARFGFASQNFYAEFLAAREIAKNYRQHFKDLRVDDPVRTGQFTVNSRTGIRELARHFQVDLNTLAGLNPALLKSVWDGRRPVPKGYRLCLPKGVATDSRLANLPTPTSPVKQRGSQSHRVKRGETISKIAQRYGITSKSLIASNQLDQRALIRVGQSLQIPSSPAKSKGKKLVVR